jgi:hypothetical protein
MPDTNSLSSPEPGNVGPPQYLFPCSLGQQALWYLDRLEPGNPAWNIAVRFRITGPLNLGLLEGAINAVLERHEVLRTDFTLVDAEPMQVVHESASIPLPVNDLVGLTAESRDAEEERLTIAEGARRFDLKSGPLIRARVLRLSELEHMLVITVHHIVSDGWSIGILSEEIAQHYSALAGSWESRAKLPALPLQYADYAAWQLERTSKSSGRDLAYWRRQLADLPACGISPDFPRPARSGHNGYILSELLPVGLTDTLFRVASKLGCTMFAVCLAALKTLIAHHSRQSDIYVGSLLAGRDRLELEPLIGLFINTVILRSDLSDDPKFSELAARVQSTAEQAFAHQGPHFQQIVQEIGNSGWRSRPVLYSINFIFQRDFVQPRRFEGLSMVPVPSKSPGAIYDLNFFMVRRSDGWRLSCEYDCDLYRPETIARLLGQLRELLTQIVENPGTRLSEFHFSDHACQPLPPFVPKPLLKEALETRQASASK